MKNINKLNLFFTNGLKKILFTKNRFFTEGVAFWFLPKYDPVFFKNYFCKTTFLTASPFVFLACR
ncbi:MAG: hypothetical protein U5L45_19150 [Saprospiraceae bacterium]|nr:hypothetical protein [Saprospiraceae bacterium]